MLAEILHYFRASRAVQRKMDEFVVLPDFRNLGVQLRIVVLAESSRLTAVLLEQGGMSGVAERVMNDSLYFEPVLLLAILVLFVFAPSLLTLPYRLGAAGVLGAVVGSGLLWNGILRLLPNLDESPPHPIYVVFVAALSAFVILWYFNWRHRVLSPALVEARLIALQARIRPHFLFNSLNAALGLIREEPRRAESVIENLAELYRALLSESGMLVALGKELDLARAYVDIEIMRLGPRLDIVWQCQSAPMDALVPPLIIQPLLENAVYHGIEPSETGGTVFVTIFLRGEQLHLVVRNPCAPQDQRRTGNQMAMNNIRERLALHFDAEAEMSAYEAGGEFVVQIRMPYKHD